MQKIKRKKKNNNNKGGNDCDINFSFQCSICGNGYPCFEISAVNADKPPLSVSQIKDRVKQFEKVGKCGFFIGVFLMF